MVHGIYFRTQNAILVFCLCILVIHHTNAQCTSTDSDTCYIERSTTWNPSESNMLQCDGQLKKCVITCSGDDLSCSSGDSSLPIYIICPVHAVSCIIECQSAKSCKGITVLATTSKYTEINIGATDAGQTMTIYSPGANGGELFVNLENTNADFYDSTIIAQQNSSKIDIDCDIGHLCANNTIEGQKVEGDTASIALSCDGLYSADCSNTNLYCSHDTIIATQQASCILDCASCENTNVYTTNGVLDKLIWNCGYDADACTGSHLYCGVDQTNDYSNLIWDTIGTQWSYQPGIGSCGFLTTHPTVAPTVRPTNVPSAKPTISTTIDTNPVEITTIRVIKPGTTSNASALTTMDPLYYVIFMLALCLGCVVCILLFWVYHQRMFDKGLNHEDKDSKIKHRNVGISSNGSIFPLSPRLVPLKTVSSAGSTRSGSNRSSQVQYDTVSTASNNSRNTSSKGRNSVLLEPNTIFNPLHTQRTHHNRSTMETASELSALNSNSSNVSQSPGPSPSPPVPLIYNQRQAKSTPNVLNARNANMREQYAMHMAQVPVVGPAQYTSMPPCIPPQGFLSPISALSGVPSAVSAPYSYTYTSASISPSATATTTATANTMSSKARKTTDSTDTTEEESVSESGESDTSQESDESESYTSSESESSSNESENTVDGVATPLNHTTQKNKFALPLHYKNMSISTSKSNLRTSDKDDKISINPQHRRHIYGYAPNPPKIPVALPPQSQLHNIPHSIPHNKGMIQTLSPEKNAKSDAIQRQKQKKRSKYKKKRKKGKKHRKKVKNDRIKIVQNKGKHGMNLSIANSVITELTELTEGTECTDLSERRKQTEDNAMTMSTEQSYSASDGLSTIASSQHTESSVSDVDTQTEFSLSTVSPRIHKESLATTKSGSSSFESDTEHESKTYTLENDNEQSKTMNSRITYEGTAREHTIESKVLDADIMCDLYDNKIKPLGISGMIDALKDEYNDDSSSSPPSPQSVTQSELK